MSKLTLESVNTEFIEWRKNKESRGSCIPDDLRKKVYQLSKSYSGKDIRKKLVLAGEQYKQFVKFYSKEESSIESNAQLPKIHKPFESSIQATTFSEVSLVPSDHFHMTLEGSNQKKMFLKIPTSHQNLFEKLVQHYMETSL